jgi:ABC-2 type transport system permease protein
MKIIFKIAKTELQKLFFSPVAWLILVIYTFQTGLTFTAQFGGNVRSRALGYDLFNITHRIYSGQFGLLSFFTSYLYLYIPLLTMGIMSRELSTGSIKLLYSSPVTNLQIILGKYLSLMIFGLALMAMLGVFVLFGGIGIVHADIPQLLCGLLGIYLLICAYSAIGLFVSSLSPYVVVAAMGTFFIFALLMYVKTLWQEIEVVRDITYWFALSGRVDTFIMGMIASEDLLYFLIVIALFLALTVLKLQSGRQKVNWLVSWGRYLAVFSAAMALGYFSALPKLKGYLDATYAKVNTLAQSSQKIIAKVPDYTTITTYTNMLGPKSFFTQPMNFKGDVGLFETYQRFNPTLTMKYVYFYHKTDWPELDKIYPKLSDERRLDTMRNVNEWSFKIVPYDKIASKIDLEPEGFRTVRVIETPDGKKTFLRFFDDSKYLPDEEEISAAFKHLVADLPTVGFLSGQGERSTSDVTDRGYNIFTQDKTFRYALINQGFDFENLTLDRPIPQKIRILVIAEMKRMLTAAEQKNLDDFIAGGGNMMILGEPGRQAFMNSISEPLGVRFLPGTLAHAPGKYSSTLTDLAITPAARKLYWYFDEIGKYDGLVTMPTANALEVNANSGFTAVPWFVTRPDSAWTELETTNFIDDTARFNAAAGELKRSFPVIVGLNRKVGSKEQKIIITGDADWLSAGELNMQRKQQTANATVIDGVFSWLSDDEVPIDTKVADPIDNTLRIGQKGWGIAYPILKWVFPAILAIAGIVIWMRRRGR